MICDFDIFPPDPLAMAILREDRLAVQSLLKDRTDLNGIGALFCMAIKTGNIELVELFISRFGRKLVTYMDGSDINPRNVEIVHNEAKEHPHILSRLHQESYFTKPVDSTTQEEFLDDQARQACSHETSRLRPGRR